MSDIECPYCGKDEHICHDDGYGYSEGETFQQECSRCGKIFVYTTMISFSYEAGEAPCLNGGNHKWKARTTCPVERTRMYCTYCDDLRDPTPEEWGEIYESRKGKSND